MAQSQKLNDNDNDPDGPAEQLSPEDIVDLDALVVQIYKKLRPLARKLQWPGTNPTLQPTALVHEAYLKLMNSKDLASKPYAEIIGIFVNVMEQIRIDAARRKLTLKRGAGAIVPLTPDDGPAHEPTPQPSPVSPEDVLTLHAALEDLKRESPRQREIIRFRFYLGMTVNEVAKVLAVAKSTVEREERNARKYLRNRIRPSKE